MALSGRSMRFLWPRNDQTGKAVGLRAGENLTWKRIKQRFVLFCSGVIWFCKMGHQQRGFHTGAIVLLILLASTQPLSDVSFAYPHWTQGEAVIASPVQFKNILIEVSRVYEISISTPGGEKEHRRLPASCGRKNDEKWWSCHTGHAKMKCRLVTTEFSDIVC